MDDVFWCGIAAAALFSAMAALVQANAASRRVDVLISYVIDLSKSCSEMSTHIADLARDMAALQEAEHEPEKPSRN